MTTTTAPRRSHAAVVIDLLGGVQSAAKVAGVGRTQIWRWTASKEQGGTGGSVPQRHHKAILRHCREQGIDLPAWLFLPEDDE